MKSQAIVIPCYNRLDSLKQLLFSLENAIYPQTVDLVFSIDYSGSNDILIFCDSYKWEHGEKKIFAHSQNIGLRANILFCGDLLVNEYDRIIVLEDDLSVSPYFCVYALSAADFYELNDEIGGISLFSYAKSEVGLFNFYPQKDENDTFFIQWPSSWGQLWTRRQWLSFKEWFNVDYDFTKISIPEYVKSWNNSWKKYYAAYLVETNRFFVFPYFSYTCEGGCPGTHVKASTTHSLFNYSLCFGGESLNFREYSESREFKYDCFFQPIECDVSLDGMNYRVSFDLYGTKSLENITTEYVVTSKNCPSTIRRFSANRIPFEINVFENNKGEMLSLVDRNSFEQGVFPIWKKLPLRMELSRKDMLKYLLYSVRKKL